MIRTARLTITPFDESHLTERYVGWLSDPVVTRYSEQRWRKHDLQSCRAYWRTFEGTQNLFVAICAPGLETEHIGTMTLYVDGPNRVGDIGIMIGEASAQGRGYGAEAFTAFVEYALNTLGLRKVTSGTMAENAPMRALMDKAAMKPDGVRRAQFLWEGQEVDLVYAARFAQPAEPWPRSTRSAGS